MPNTDDIGGPGGGAARTRQLFQDRIADKGLADRVLAHPEVEAAIEALTGAALYAALKKAARSIPPGDEREALGRVLSLRRDFADPIRSAPALWRLNGIGTTLLGNAEADRASGTYVATTWFTFFFVPLVPISSYLVRKASSRGWNFFARVPLARGHRLLRRSVGGAVLLAVLGVWLAARHASAHSAVWFVSGLDVRVETTIGGETVRLDPGTPQVRDLASGTYHLVTKGMGGATIEERDVEVPHKTDLVLYNVLGAAPVGLNEIVYSTGSEKTSAESGGEALVGEPWTVRDGVRYLFAPPPKTIKMTSPREMRRAVALEQGGWRACANYFAGKGDSARAADLASKVALAQRDDPAIQFAANAALLVGPPRALQFAESAAAVAPESVEAHRMLQEALRLLGRKAESAARYKAAYEKDPTSARAAYLYVRTLPGAEARPLLERFVAEHPDDFWLLRSLGWQRVERREFAAAVTAIEKIAALNPQVDRLTADLHVLALVGAGRVADAERIAFAAIVEDDWDALVLYGKVRRLPGAARSGPDPIDHVPKVFRRDDLPDDLRSRLAVAIGDAAAFDRAEASIRDNAVREALRLDLRVASDLEGAAAVAEKASDEGLASLSPVSRVALACEFLRTGREAAAARIFAGGGIGLEARVSLASLRAPTAALDDDDIDMDLKAALAFAASRRAEAPAERDRLLALAREYDVFRSIVPR